MRVEKIKREDTYMQNNKNNENKNMKARILALVLAGLMIFSAVAGVLISLLA